MPTAMVKIVAMIVVALCVAAVIVPVIVVMLRIAAAIAARSGMIEIAARVSRTVVGAVAVIGTATAIVGERVHAGARSSTEVWTAASGESMAAADAANVAAAAVAAAAEMAAAAAAAAKSSAASASAAVSDEYDGA